MSKIAELEFTLTQDEMQQMLGVANFNRFRHQTPPQTGALRVRFSAMLSPEGQLAMSQALQDTKILLKHIAAHGDNGSQEGTTRDRHQRHRNPRGEAYPAVDGRQPSAGMAEIFERLGTPRMTEDLTGDADDFSSDYHMHIRSLDGTKKNNSMEIVEIINYDKSNLKGVDDAAIEEIAKRNSVEKCKVWIEAHTETDDSNISEDNQNTIIG